VSLRASSELSLYPLPAGACAGSPGKWRAGKQGGGSSRAPGKPLGSHAGGQVAGGSDSAGRDTAGRAAGIRQAGSESSRHRDSHRLRSHRQARGGFWLMVRGCFRDGLGFRSLVVALLQLKGP
jgi:hypothetical protein